MILHLKSRLLTTDLAGLESNLTQHIEPWKYIKTMILYVLYNDSSHGVVFRIASMYGLERMLTKTL